MFRHSGCQCLTGKGLSERTGKPHVRICEGEAEWLSYPTTVT